MALSPGSMLGPYRIERHLGDGGMGSVYEALHQGIDRKVAIKVLHSQHSQQPDVVARFFNEARAVNRIDHPSMVHVSEATRLDDGTAYLVMDLLRGESLAARLRRSKSGLPVAEATRLARQIAAAMAAAHAQGIIHRDLKPDNIMLVPDAEIEGRVRVRILDFGIAKLVDASRDAQWQADVQSGVVLGTPAYMAPEQCRRPKGVDEKADVYALGIMLYEMLCGHPPFIGNNPMQLLMMQINDPPPPLDERGSAVPGHVSQLVFSMLSKQKEDRPLMSQVALLLSSGEASGEHALRPPPSAAYPAGPPQAESGPVSPSAPTLATALSQRPTHLMAPIPLPGAPAPTAQTAPTAPPWMAWLQRHRAFVLLAVVLGVLLWLTALLMGGGAHPH